MQDHLPAPGDVTGSEVYGPWAQVKVSGDTMSLAVFGGGWRVVAGCTPRPSAVRLHAAGELTMRALFVSLLIGIAAGLIYFTSLGVLHR